MVVICEKCGKSFLKPCKLKLHVETVHLKLKKFKCSHCDECLASSVALKYHIVRKHQDHCDYSCEDCDRSFKTQSGLDQHLNVHDKGKTFVCQECNMELKHRTLFKNHMKKHEMMKDTTCKFCHKTYPTHQKMKEHFYNTHRKNPMLRCSFCTKKYFQQVTLDKHLAVHSILICDFCGFKQVNKELMTKHILIHLREINVNCKVEPKITKKDVKKYQKSISRKEGRLKNSENLLIPPVLDNLKEDPLTNPLEIEQIVIKDEIDDIKNEDNEVADPSDKSDSSNQIVGFAERNSEAKTKIVKRRSKTIPCKAENCESKFCSIKEMHEHTAKVCYFQVKFL